METTTINPLTLLIKYGLVDREDGTIFDTKTKLLWQRVPSDDTYTWEEAYKYCKSLTLGGYNDWRLPTLEELRTLIDKRHEPTICPIFECKLDWYWSSTSDTDFPAIVWLVYFGYGYASNDDKDTHIYVRAVRG